MGVTKIEEASQMVGEISSVTRTEVLRAIRNRYREASNRIAGAFQGESQCLLSSNNAI